MAVAVAAPLLAELRVGVRPPRVLELLSRTMRASTQLPVRFALLMLAALIVLLIEFGFEGILGAFVAGMVIGLATRGPDGELFRGKIDAVCFGWFSPFFFIGTGMQFDLGALARDVTTMLLVPAFVVLFLLVRGAPVYFYRRDLASSERLPFALFSGVASLGLVIVITQVGLRTKDMNPDVAQALVGAALLSLLLYPTLGGIRLSRIASMPWRATPP